jgi:hydrogenase maturation protease
MSFMNTSLVLGVGNVLLADEGAGVYAMQHMSACYRHLPQTRFLDAGTLSFTLAADIAAADNLLIFDATEMRATPGTVRVFEGSDLDDYLCSGRRSVHEVGVADLMDIARLQDCLPVNRALIGVQPQLLGWGDGPGPRVSRALPRMAELGAALLQRWLAAKATAEPMAVQLA